MFMRAQEVVVSHPESQIITGAVDVIKPVCVTARSFISTVQPFDHLFERTVFRRYRIVVGKSNDLSDLESKVLFGFTGKFHCGKRVSAVTIGNELKIFREFSKPPESHAHSEDAGADATAIGYLIADDGTGGSVHNEPDVGSDAADLYVGFIGSEHRTFFVGIEVNKGLDADSGCFAVVGDLLVRDAYVVKILQSQGNFAQGEAGIDMQSQA